MMSAVELIQKGLQVLKERATGRGLTENQGERVMNRTTKIFNATTGRDMTEREGWLFMVCLKMARAQEDKRFNPDDYIDGSNYWALTGECTSKERGLLMNGNGNHKTEERAAA